MRARTTHFLRSCQVRFLFSTAAAVAFAGLLVLILRSDEVRGMLVGLVRAALSIPS
ncbi:DUF4244 domain-containing protein [Mycetocola spongiae]|uniref:DUF4244 domain-containing protein n=1 Tax=Mycetocola spongiae TaxID=2859226 RepID=UPI001CF3F99B|nr:DUF4244 domain-containing protein [Mycetocola spongiae]